MVPATASFRDRTPDGAAFGEFLRQARERRGLTLQQISNETKIPWRHLDALEHGQLNAVPGGTYRRGEIRAYAEVVGLDKAQALERLDRALEASAATVAAPAAASSSPWWQRYQAPPWFTLLWIGAASLIALRLLWPASSPAAAPGAPEPLASRAIALPSAPAPLLQAVSVPAIAESAAIVESPAVAEGAVGEALVVAAQAPPGTPAGLTITSDPPGARVTVDGIARGITPVTIPHLAPGDRRVRLTMPAFSAAERVVRLSADQPAATVHVTLDGIRLPQ